MYYLTISQASNSVTVLNSFPSIPQLFSITSFILPLSFNQLFSMFPNSMPRTLFILQLPMLYSVLSFRATSEIKRRPFWSLKSVPQGNSEKCRNFRVWSVSRQSELLPFQSLYGGVACSMHMAMWAVKDRNFGTRESRILGTQASMK